MTGVVSSVVRGRLVRLRLRREERRRRGRARGGKPAGVREGLGRGRGGGWGRGGGGRGWGGGGRLLVVGRATRGRVSRAGEGVWYSFAVLNTGSVNLSD